MKIAFITADWDHGDPPMPGGAGWVRLYEPANQLIKAGHECVFGMGVAQRGDGLLFPVNQVGRPIQQFIPEIIVLQRWMHVDAEVTIKQARAAGQKIVQDVDDYFFGVHPSNQAYDKYNKRKHPTHNISAYHKGIAASDLITASTDLIAKRYKERLGIKSVIIRNAVDVDRFNVQQVRDQSEDLVVGWVGATQWRSNDLETISGFFDDWLQKNRSKFVHHGATQHNPKDAYERLSLSEDTRGDFKHMVRTPEYPKLVREFDFGIIPLNRVDFNNAKSWIKGLEYSAAGIPFVVDDLPEYKRLGVGELVHGKVEWLAALNRLKDPAYRKDASAACRERAEQEDIKHRWKDWEQVYSGLLG